MKRFRFLVSLILLCAAANLHAAHSPRLFSGNERSLAVAPTRSNYYLATLTEESKSYDPIFYDDYLVTIDSKPAVQFTKVHGQIVDYYFHVTNREDMKFLSQFFAQHRSRVESFAPHLISVFEEYRALEPEYKQKDIHRRVGVIIERTAHVTVEQLIDKMYRTKVDAALYRYLRSNGVVSLEDVTLTPAAVDMLINKFYMLSTTCFYREWIRTMAFREYLPPLKEAAKKQKRPFKACVFACSSGEEVLTYAIELMEAGITDFTILASDINDSSLDFARAMKYPDASFYLLPYETQKKIKKYFKQDAASGQWEPKDPALFRQRISYINHNILNKLPAGLEERFAPPYDMVSILNVLLYLNDDEVQLKKDYWTQLLASGGIMILHDSRYSILTGKLGEKWGFQNFLIINDCVNLRADATLSADKKLLLYEENFRASRSEIDMMILGLAYRSVNKLDKAAFFYEEYLKSNPYSVTAMTLALNHYINTMTNMSRVTELTATLASKYILSENILDNIITFESDTSMLPAWKKLRERFTVFMETYKASPKNAETLFDYQLPQGEVNDARILLKCFSYTLLQEYYYSGQMMNEFEQISLEGLDIAQQLFARRTQRSYPLIGKYVDLFGDKLAQYYIEKGEYDRALAVSTQSLHILIDHFSDTNEFYLLYGLGDIYLAKAIVYDKQKKGAEAAEAAQQAMECFTKVLPYLDRINLFALSTFYGKIGHSHYLVGNHHLAQGDERSAEKAFEQSFVSLEKAIEIVPVYGRNAAKLRDELVDVARSRGFMQQFISQKDE